MKIYLHIYENKLCQKVSACRNICGLTLGSSCIYLPKVGLRVKLEDTVTVVSKIL